MSERGFDAVVIDPTRLDGPGLEQLPPDPRADTEAMAAYPWREAYFDELRRAAIEFRSDPERIALPRP